MIPFKPCIAVSNAELCMLPVVDGQLIVVVEAGSLYFDYNQRRIQLAGGASAPDDDSSSSASISDDSSSSSDSSSSVSVGDDSSSSSDSSSSGGDAPSEASGKLVPEAVTPAWAASPANFAVVNAAVKVSASIPSGRGGVSGAEANPEVPASVSGYEPAAITPASAAVIPVYAIAHGNLSV